MCSPIREELRKSATEKRTSKISTPSPRLVNFLTAVICFMFEVFFECKMIEQAKMQVARKGSIKLQIVRKGTRYLGTLPALWGINHRLSPGRTRPIGGQVVLF